MTDVQMQQKIQKIQMSLTPWYKQKTSWTTIAGVLGTIGSYFAGEVSLMPTIWAVVGGLVIIFGRQGVEKSRIPYGELPASQRGDSDIVG
jgi:hypothetical protein